MLNFILILIWIKKILNYDLMDVGDYNFEANMIFISIKIWFIN